MARFLERLIPSLAKAVARAEIPASERRTAPRRRARSRRYPWTPVASCSAPTGFDSGDPRWRR
jgi:hypothetical protein